MLPASVKCLALVPPPPRSFSCRPQTIAEVLHHQKHALVFVASNDVDVKRRVSALFPGRVLSFQPDARTLEALGCDPHAHLFGERETTYGPPRLCECVGALSPH